jgi:ribosome-associated heat shock protein Hsp15
MSDHAEERTRIDKWLWAARFFKTRSLATQAVEGGKVLLNSERVKPAKGLRVGDELRIRTPVFEYTVQVAALSDKRGSASVAALLFTETPESIAKRDAARADRPPRDPSTFIRGRPTKRDRRQLQRLRDDPDGG